MKIVTCRRTILVMAAVLFCVPWASVVSAKKSPDAEAISALELSEELSNFYTNFVGIVEVTFGKAGEGVTDGDRLRTLALAKLRLARAAKSSVFQLDPRNALLDTWSLCVQFRLYVESERAPADIGAENIPAVRDAALRIERDIVLIASQFLPANRINEVGAQIETFAKAHPLSSVHAVTPPPSIQATKGGGNLDVGWILNLPLAPFHAMEGVDHTAQAVADFAKVVDSIDRTVSNLPMETAWETELLLLNLRRDLATLLDDKTAKLNDALRSTINMAAVRLVEAAAAIFVLALLYHFITRRWFPRLVAKT